MSKLGGTWINLDGTTADGEHPCTKPYILPGIFAPKIGAVWECDCGQQWVIQSHQPPDVPGAPAYRHWHRVEAPTPTRSQVLDRMVTLLPADHGQDDLARDHFALALKYLETLNLHRWRPVDSRTGRR